MRSPELATRADVMERLDVLKDKGPSFEHCPSIMLTYWTAFRRAVENVRGDLAGTEVDGALDSVMIAIDQAEDEMRNVDVEKDGPTRALRLLGQWRGYTAAAEAFR